MLIKHLGWQAGIVLEMGGREGGWEKEREGDTETDLALPESGRHR